jgi:hypothetical protein
MFFQVLVFLLMSDVAITNEEKLKLLLGLGELIPEAVDAIREKGDAATAGEFSRALASKERFTRWCKASALTVPFEKFMEIVVQGLGKVDCQLIHDHRRYSNLSQAEKISVQEVNKLNDNYTLSYLWVLGAYEIVRTMSQRVRNDPRLLASAPTGELQSLKRLFERLRIPLAKMEPSKKHPRDAPIAYPAFHADLGISWRLGQNLFISRRELADALLKFLESLGGTS